MKPLLTILIPTVIGREKQFEALRLRIENQLHAGNIGKSEVEIMHLSDDKTMTIGEKRNKLHEMANGIFCWTVDDDDDLVKIVLVVDAIREHGDKVDCIGFKELCIFNGKKVESSCFSLRYSDWADNVDGYNHVRTPFFKTPIKTSIVQSTRVENIRFGEDHAFSRAIKHKLHNEFFIDEFIYIYQHNDEGGGSEKRYGFYKDQK